MDLGARPLLLLLLLIYLVRRSWVKYKFSEVTDVDLLKRENKNKFIQIIN